MDIEFEIQSPEGRIVAQMMGQTEITRGMTTMLGYGARLSYMGRELPCSPVTESAGTVYFFVLRIPDWIAVETAADLLWDLLTSRDPDGLITTIDIQTKTERRRVDLRDPAGKYTVESSIRALQKEPIPKALWLGE